MSGGESLILPGVDTNNAAVPGGSNYYDQDWHDGGLANYAATNLTMTVNRLYGCPTVLPAGTYDRVGIVVGAAAAAGKLLRVLVYAMGSNGLPGALLLDPGANLAADAIATVEHTISFTLAQTTLIVPSVWSDGAPQIGAWTTMGRAWFGKASGSAAKQGVAYKDGTFGSPPSPFGTPTGYISATMPRIRWRAA